MVVTNAEIKSEDIRRNDVTVIWADADSEQAKAIGVRHAKGEICAMFCADNMIMEKDLFNRVKRCFDKSNASAFYPAQYAYVKEDNSLNRYFSLIGGNDPVCYYLGKNDRAPHGWDLQKTSNYQPSYGCNGFFYRSEDIKSTNLDNYYPMDNAMEICGRIYKIPSQAIWHRTSDNLISFLKKRYRYARDLYSDRTNRRWKIIDTHEDRRKLLWFIISTISIIPCLWISFRGYSKFKDMAWFLHWPVCFGFLVTYTALAIRNLFKHGKLFQCRQAQSLSQRLVAKAP